MKNSLDTAFDEGKEEGIEVGEQKKERQIVINGLRQGLDKVDGVSFKAIEGGVGVECFF